jgi:hypothetical protein
MPTQQKPFTEVNQITAAMNGYKYRAIVKRIRVLCWFDDSEAKFISLVRQMMSFDFTLVTNPVSAGSVLGNDYLKQVR